MPTRLHKKVLSLFIPDTLRLIEQQESFYLPRLAKNGIHSCQSVGWSEQGQQMRFAALAKFIRDKELDHTILDIGCGLGDYYEYLWTNGFTRIEYTGMDILKVMIDGARNKYPDQTFLAKEFLSYEFKTSFDFIFCSGAMNLLNGGTIQRHENMIQAFILKMYAIADIGCIFNVLDKQYKSQFHEKDLFYYADSSMIEHMCNATGGTVRVIEHPETFDLVFYIKKDTITRQNNIMARYAL